MKLTGNPPREQSLGVGAELETLSDRFQWRRIAVRFVECLRDDRGTALTEYLIVSGVALPIAMYLFHPDNGLYKTARDQYDRTVALLVFPGP